jgi:tetratricopeptide (TPR) repeat protein
MTSLRLPIRSLLPCLVLLAGASRTASAGPVDEECERLRQAGIKLLAESEDLLRVRSDGAPDVGAARRKQSAAVAKFEQALRLCPEDPESPFWLGTAHVLRDDVEGYARAMAALRAVAPRDVRVDYLQAHFHLEVGGRPDLAVAGFERVRARVPGFRREQLSILLFRAYMDYGVHKANEAIRSSVAAQTGIYKEALTQFSKAVREGAPSPIRVYMARRNLAEILRKSSEYVRAEAEYRTLLRAWPDDPIVHYGLATVVADQLRYADAVPHWEAALRLRDRVRANEPTKMIDARLRYGMTLLYAGRSAEARTQLEGFVAEAPKDVRGLTYLGLFERDHPFHVAVRALEKPVEGGPAAVARDPKERRAEVSRALAPLLGKTPAEVEAVLQDLPAVVAKGIAEEEADKISDALEPLGVDVRQEPLFDRAIELLEAAWKLDPLCEEAPRALLGIYTTMKPNPERAKLIAAWLDDEQGKAARERARKARIPAQPDLTEGCQ